MNDPCRSAIHTNDDHIAVAINCVEAWSLSWNLAAIAAWWGERYWVKDDKGVWRVVELIKKERQVFQWVKHCRFKCTYINADAVLDEKRGWWMISRQVSVELMPIFVPLHRIELLVFHVVVALQLHRVVLHCVVGNANFYHSKCIRKFCNERNKRVMNGNAKLARPTRPGNSTNFYGGLLC